MFVAQTIWRSVSLGLLAACVVLLAQLRPPSRDVTYVTVPPPPPRSAVRYLTIGADVEDVVPLLGLAPNERVIEVDGGEVTSNLAAGVAIERAQRLSSAFWIYTASRAICVMRS